MPAPGLTRRQCLLAAAALPVAAARAQPGAVLRIVGPWEVNSLEPASAGFLFARLQVAETLTGADDSGAPQPALAAGWSVSDDGLVWRFTLRPGARFHDGSAVSTAHVATALQRAHGKPGPWALAPLQALQAEGDTLRVQLRTPFAALPAVLAHSSALVLAPASFDERGAVQRIVGSGPYRVTRLEAPQRIEVEAVPGWGAVAPAVQRASYLAAGRAETRALMAEAGQAELAFALDPASQQRLRRGGRVQVAAVTVPRTAVVKVNAGHRWLADPRARLALSLAIDRAGIARGLLRDAELAATQLFPPTLGEWHDSTLAPLRHDPAAARRLWAELGWQPGANGVLQRDGQPLALTLRTFPDRPELPLLAAALQEQWRQTGLAVKVAIGNSSDVPARHRDGTLEMALLARHYGLVPDPVGTLLQDFGPRGGDWGAMNWHDERLAAALAELARGTPRRAALRAQAASVLQAELPVIPVAWYRQTAAVSPRVAGLSLDPLERSYRLDTLRWQPGAA